MSNSTLPSVASNQSGELQLSSGAKQISNRMADRVLEAIQVHERALAARRRYRIGEYNFQRPDFEQIQRWAAIFRFTPEQMVQKLERWEVFSDWQEGAPLIKFLVEDGCIVSLPWNFKECPLTDWGWVDGLRLELLALENFTGRQLPSLPSVLRRLCCLQNQLVNLELQEVPNLTELSCSSNELTELDLSRVPRLTKLSYGDNPRSNFDLHFVPYLSELGCGNNDLTELDLSPVPRLTTLDCWGNKLTILDLIPVPLLTILSLP